MQNIYFIITVYTKHPKTKTIKRLECPPSSQCLGSWTTCYDKQNIMVQRIIEDSGSQMERIYELSCSQSVIWQHFRILLDLYKDLLQMTTQVSKPYKEYIWIEKKINPFMHFTWWTICILCRHFRRNIKIWSDMWFLELCHMDYFWASRNIAIYHWHLT